MTRIFRAIREAVSAPAVRTESQFKKPDGYIQGNPYRVQSPRDLATLTRGAPAPAMKVPDNQIIGFLDDLSRGGPIPTRRTGSS